MIGLYSVPVKKSPDGGHSESGIHNSSSETPDFVDIIASYMWDGLDRSSLISGSIDLIFKIEPGVPSLDWYERSEKSLSLLIVLEI